MVSTSEIGLVAWGLKLGKDVFFSSDNINPNAAEIVRTMEDARGIINMHRTNQVFYSIEFTPVYKVYTIYRTIIDWGNRDNAYLALSLFVKYPIVFEDGVLPVLKALVRIYEEHYIDENHRIKRTQERRDLFFDKLNSFTCKKTDWSLDRPNRDGNTEYVHIRYKDDQELTEFFNNPFLEEYAPYKEIFFLKAGNNDITPVKAIETPLNIKPRPLFRTIRFEVKDGNNEPLNIPIQCKIDGISHDYKTPFEVKEEQITDLSIEFIAEDYLKFKKTINVDEVVSKNVPYAVILEKRQNVTLLIVNDNGDGIAGAKVNVSLKNFVKSHSYITNEKGEALLKDFFMDENFHVVIQKEEFETYDKPVSPSKSTVLITLKKKKQTPPPVDSNKVIPPSPDKKGHTNTGSLNQQKEKNTTHEEKGDKDDKTGNDDQEPIQEHQSKIKDNSPGFIRKNLWLILISLAFIAIVSIAAWYYFIIYMGDNQKLSETKENLMKVLTKEYSSVTIELGGIQSEMGSFDSAGIGNLYGTFSDIEKKIGALENMTKTDSINLGQKIQDFTSQDTTAKKLETEITTTFASLRNETQHWQDSLMRFKEKAQAERERMQKESVSNKVNELRRAELKRLAETMCNGKSNNASNYKQEVEANKIEFTDVEKRDLTLKFELIRSMLNLEYKGRKEAASFTDQNQYKDALRGIKSKSGHKLSPVQKKWLDNAIEARWPLLGQ